MSQRRTTHDFSAVRVRAAGVAATGGPVMIQRQMVTPLGPGGGHGGLLERDRQPKAAIEQPSQRPEVQRQALPETLQSPPRVSGPPAPTPPVARGSLSSYRTAAQGYITAYEMAARAGIANFNTSVSADFDWGLFWAQVGGNLLWATASFATGGTAFLVSVAGIGITTAAAAGAVTGAPSFATNAGSRINDVVTYLNNQVDRVTQDVDRQALTAAWDDNQERREILRRMLPDRFVVTADGGLPNVNTRAIAASVQQQLLIEAAATQPRKGSVAVAAMGRLIPTIIRDYNGYAMYSYRGSNVEDDGGYFGRAFMKPFASWRTNGPSVALVPSANVGDINATINAAQTDLGGPMRVAAWPCRKAINIYTDEPHNPVLIVELNEGNQVTAARGWGVVHEYLEEHDRISFGREVATRLWGGTTPPDAVSLAAPPELFQVNPAAAMGRRAY